MSLRPRVAVGLSGGVDSSLAAALLKAQGYEVLGLTMKIWNGGLRIKEVAKHACYGPGEEEDIAACERLAARLGIEYQVIDLAEEYEAKVLDYFRREYRAGRTPNPCVICNRELKFGFLLERARGLGLEFSAFATGHYARIVERNGVLHLARARDEAKDQSYFLYALEAERLAGIRFPLGELTKEEVRREARALGLEVADKPESQDFVAGGDYSPLFEDSPPEPGDFVDEEGRVLGKHRGLPFYTVGQRRGLGISIGPEPLYVLRLEASTNRVVLGANRGLFSEGLLSRDFRLQDPRLGTAPFEAFAKIRQAHTAVPCRVYPGSPWRVEFREAQRAVAPGQAVVIYDAEGLLLGGGLIERALDAGGV